ncbi:tyrosine-type recombinase/integrase [Methylobacillus flagellatus]|uniref:tyrosine-type recombinase/integrase n=1 Tax=Methylobacillus flagellatus TaxID=405 RepID=UPI0010F6AB4B|nr:integrase arm-type DNA-binding domain-containing protein [Methylobacillus flagellatus]
MKLTDMKCRAAKCDGQKILKLGDGGGLYLWVLDTGRKFWKFRYKIDQRENSLTIGDYPGVSITDARKKAREWQDMLKSGQDPSSERRRATRVPVEVANSFEVVGREWYEKNESLWKPAHAKDVLRRLEVNIFPHLGKRAIDRIKGPELLEVIMIMEKRGATDLSHRVNSVVGQVFRYGIAKGICNYDIAASIKDALKPHKVVNQSCIPIKSIGQLMRDIATYREKGGDEHTMLGLQLLAHTFPRTMELISSHKSEFDLDAGVWEVPEGRMKNGQAHIVPLSTQVKQIVTRLIELSGHSDYLLPGLTFRTHISTNTLLYALYRLGYRHRMTGHGFRAMASTVLNESGWNSAWIEMQLAHHDKNKVRAAYNRAQYLKYRKEMMQWWSDYLEAAEQGKPLPEYND